MHHDFFRISEYFDKNSDLSLPSCQDGYKWSQRIWISERNNTIAIFRPLNLGIVYFQKESLRKSSGKIDDMTFARQLEQERFLIPEAEDIDEAEHQVLIDAARKGTFRFICILPTTACELKCAYCHQKPRGSKPLEMTSDEIRKGLKKCASLCTDLSKPVDILLYGGDPLNAFHLTEDVLELADGSPGIFKQKVRKAFTSTGYGLTEKHSYTLAQHDVFVILSLDGPPEINDSVRRATSGKSSFEVAERAYEILKRHGCRVGLSVTIGKHNIEDLEKTVAWLLERFELNDIGLNAFLHWIGNQPNAYQVDSEAAFDAFIDAFEVTSDRGVYAEQPFRRLKPFIRRQPLLKDCSSPGERLVLAPGGVMGFCDSCYPDNQYFYPIDSFPEKEHPDRQIWEKLASPEMPVCQECPAMTVCGGACRYDAFKASGRLDGIDPERCKFERAFLNWMIWELFDQRKNKDTTYYLPEDAEREVLLGNVKLKLEDQPFTAGSYSS